MTVSYSLCHSIEISLWAMRCDAYVHIQWLIMSSEPIILSNFRDVHTTYYPEDGDNLRITRGFQLCIHVQSGCRD